MNTVCPENKCAGCMACIDICPQNAIKIVDEISHYNAVIEQEKCINCGQCHNVCQENRQPAFRYPQTWHQGWASDEAIRASSASGGFAAAIQRSFIQHGGVVCSCTFDKGEIVFKAVDCVDGVNMFRGSKYVKSNPVGIYKIVQKYINDGREVLFVGLPCQVSSIKNYLKDSERLFSVDLICHGTPSPRVLDNYLHEKRIELKNINALSFRTGNSFYITADGKRLTIPELRDYYSMCFYRGLIYTENCYECKYARLERISDLTIGDAWGSDLPQSEKTKGISLVLCQTQKGKKLLDDSDVILTDISLEKASEANTQLRHPSIKSQEADYILKKLSAGSRLTHLIRRMFPKMYYKDILKTVRYNIKYKRQQK